jgi:AcrR family transcriptional regulator
MRIRKEKVVIRRDEASVVARVLDAAQQEFMRVGYSAANTNVMAQSGVSKATIFRYYPTKRVLFEAVIRRIAERWHEQVTAGSHDQADPRAWLCEFGLGTLRWILSDEALFIGRMAIAEGPIHDEIRQIWTRHAVEPIDALLVANFSHWQSAKVLKKREPSRLAVMFLDLILSGRVSRALYGAVESKDAIALRNHVENCVDLFLVGCANPKYKSALAQLKPRKRPSIATLNWRRRSSSSARK